MTRAWRFLCGAVVICAAQARTTEAQQERYGPIVLLLPSSPRAAVLGRVAGLRDTDAIFGNPALVGTSVGTLAGFGRYDGATRCRSPPPHR